MSPKPTYEELEQRVKELEAACDGREETTRGQHLEGSSRGQERYLKDLLQTMQAGLIVHDLRKDRIIDYNATALQILGLTASELTDRSTIEPGWAFVHEDGSPMEIDAYPVNVVRRTQKPLENYIVGIVKPAQSQTTWALVNALPQFDEKGQLSRVVISSMDVTKSKTVERESLMLRTAIDQAPVGIALADENISIYYCNPEGLGMRGGHREELVEIPQDAFKNWQVCKVDGEPYEIADLPLVRTVNSGKVIREEFIVRHQDGTDHICDAIACPVIERGRIVGGIVIFLEITERKQAEEKLRKSEERLNLIIKGSKDAPWDWDLVTDDLYYSPQWWNQLGYAPGELAADPDLWQRLMHPDDADRVNNFFQTVLADGTERYEVEFRLRHKKAHYVSVLSRGFITRNERGEPVRVSGTNMDLTERYRVEKLLQQAQKMEAIGTLAGGIAHDFNNSLNVISGNISYALSLCDGDSELAEVLVDVQNGTRHATTLTHQLLTFAKGGEPVTRVQNVHKIVKEAALFNTRGSRSRCEFALADDIWSARVDAGQMNQVIGNLVINADQAMPDGGVIAISSENVEIEQGSVLQLTPGKYIKISIEDSGIGIHKDHLFTVFEPYFSTKQKGSGLGLATAYSIIKRHGGRITVYSELGRGSVFHVYLPAALEPAAQSEDISPASHSGQGRILVMDDEGLILKMISRMISKMGYQVETAGDGREAVALYENAYNDGAPFDLVILDLTIPGGMGGARTIVELLTIDPAVKAVVSSGYSNDPIMANYRDYGFCAVMPKPYTKATVAEILEEVLGSAHL